MSDETKDKAAWLDLRVPGRAHAALKRWGARLGVSPEGMARMLLLMRVHELLGDAVDDVPEDTLQIDEGTRSMALWKARLESIGLTSDQLPAPVGINGDTRIYHADTFAWPEGATPTFAFAHVTGDGKVGVSKQADA